jgi:glutathione S-transferase
MELRFALLSPYARKVRVVAHEVGVAERIEMTVVNVREKPEDIVPWNPLGKIPALRLDDGSVLYDSPVICEYFDTLAGGKLFPQAFPERLVALRRQSLGDGMLDTLLMWRGEATRTSRDCRNPTV